jgi:hypothetical protein
MSDTTGRPQPAETTDAGDGLLSRVQLIDDAPLEERAAAYLQVHEQLRTRLEG